ncbi:MAG TPA: DedA family protein [Ktedonobacterales bacterium]|nr:DedA family protein [Ktedonobacterales bacterium]
MHPVILAIMEKAPSGIPSWADHLLRQYGVLALFAIVALQDCGIPTLIPGTVFVIAGGYLVYAGYFPFHLAALSITLGAFLGASALFFISRRGGRPLVLYLGRFVGLTEAQFDASARLLERWGAIMLFVTRVAPGTRVYMTAFAGISGWTYRRFALWTAIFSLIWAYGFVLLGYELGPQWDRIAPSLRHYSNLFFLIVSILLVLGLIALIARIWRTSRMQPTTLPATPNNAATSSTTASQETSSKEQARANSRSGGGRILRVADSPPSLQSRPRRRNRR